MKTTILVLIAAVINTLTCYPNDPAFTLPQIMPCFEGCQIINPTYTNPDVGSWSWSLTVNGAAGNINSTTGEYCIAYAGEPNTPTGCNLLQAGTNSICVTLIRPNCPPHETCETIDINVIDPSQISYNCLSPEEASISFSGISSIISTSSGAIIGNSVFGSLNFPLTVEVEVSPGCVQTIVIDSPLELCNISIDDTYTCSVNANSELVLCPQSNDIICLGGELTYCVNDGPDIDFNECVSFGVKECLSLAVIIDVSSSSNSYFNTQKTALANLVSDLQNGNILSCYDVELSIIPHGIGSSNNCSFYNTDPCTTDCICSTPLTDNWGSLSGYVANLASGGPSVTCANSCDFCSHLFNNDLGAIQKAKSVLAGQCNPVLIYTSDGAPQEGGECGGTLGNFICSEVESALNGVSGSVYGVLLGIIECGAGFLTGSTDGTYTVPSPGSSYPLSDIVASLGDTQNDIVKIKYSASGCAQQVASFEVTCSANACGSL